VRFAVEAGLRYGREEEYVTTPGNEYNLGDPEMIWGDALTLCSLGVTKLIVQHPGYAFDKVLGVTLRHAGDLATVTHSGSNFVEVAAANVTKAHTLEAICAAREAGREAVIAFGDMPNDLPVLEWAGHGVAVANAHPEVLARADEITASNDEDGVAVVLERLAACEYVLQNLR
jgi:hypothetical protein